MKTILVTLFILISVAPSWDAFANTPLHLWSRAFGSPQIELVEKVAVDYQGNLILTGSFTGTIDFGGGPLTSAGSNDIFLVKLDPDGNHMWSRGFGSSGTDIGRSVAVFPGGDIALTGYYSGTIDFGGGAHPCAGMQDAFVLRYSASGSYLWSSVFGDASSQIASQVQVDAAKDIVLAGPFTGTINLGGANLVSAGGNDIFLAKFSQFGAHLWSKRFGEKEDQIIDSLAVDDDLTILIGGHIRDSIDFGGGLLIGSGEFDIFTARFDHYGSHLQSTLFGDSDFQYQSLVAFDPSGRYYVAAYVQGSIDFGGGPLVDPADGTVVLACFSDVGTHIWSRILPTSGQVYPQGLSLDSNGLPVLSGFFYSDLDLGNGTIPSQGSRDGFLAKYLKDGSFFWGITAGDASIQDMRATAPLADGTIYAAGIFQGTMDLGGGSLVSQGMYDIALARLGDPPAGTILAIEDVAYDQGRHVRLTIEPSLLDAPGSATPILQYEVYRRIDPLPDKMAGWDFVAAVPAHGDSEYSLVCPTLADSTIADGMYWSVFLLRAATADPYLFFASLPDSGYSLDNLAPAAPSGLSLPAPDLLAWAEVPVGDLAYYSVFAASDPSFADAVLVGSTTATEFDVAGTGGSFLAVTATDFAGNEGPRSVLMLNPSEVPGAPAAVWLGQNAPNPFNPRTVIPFALAAGGPVQLAIHGLDGGLVAVLIDGELPAGPHSVVWDGLDDAGRPAPTGMYLYSISTPGFSQARKLVLVR